MDDLTILGLAAACWAAAGYKAWTARRRPATRSLDALWSSLGSLGAALTLFSPPVYRGVYRISRVANLAELAGHSLVLVSASQARTLLLYLEDPESEAAQSVRRQRGLLVVTIAGMTIVFALAPVDRDAPGSFTREFASAPWVAEYWALFLLNLSATLLQMVYQCWQLAGIAERPFLQRGLRSISVGGVLGVTYFLHWGAYLIIRRAGHELPPSVRAAARLTAVGAVGAIVAGSLLPAVGPRVAQLPALRSTQLHRSLRRLHPLWAALCSAVPEVALDTPTSRWNDLTNLRDLEHRRYRRVIEIRDAWLALRPYMAPSVRLSAQEQAERHGLSGPRLEAIVEAASLMAAIETKRGGAPAAVFGERNATSAGTDLGSESAWLEEVAKAFVTPLVRGVVAGQGASRVRSAVKASS